MTFPQQSLNGFGLVWLHVEEYEVGPVGFGVDRDLLHDIDLHTMKREYEKHAETDGQDTCKGVVSGAE